MYGDSRRTGMYHLSPLPRAFNFNISARMGAYIKGLKGTGSNYFSARITLFNSERQKRGLHNAQPLRYCWLQLIFKAANIGPT
jgi:hypothetical protein